ncbi:type II toxin-antitoxin system HipA family toxin [Galactobacter valiniphilus]|uniref:type II toxin-antitoxin system HipA family toxin n=1 Tax=Galactobacter valiniphilus TaxID=2676122 RepID=UPI002D793FC4|nr:HipA domain-containing protein [Galactobacter valiniphilus]
MTALGRDLEDLRLVQAAEVLKRGVLAATLTRRPDGGVVLEYADDYAGPAVATTLPVGAEAVATTGGGLPAFFAGVLPEGHRLNVLRGAVKASPDDELSLLLAVGEDLPGDVQVVPAGAAPVREVDVAAVVGSAAEADFAELMQEPDLTGLAGVQAKLSASMLSTPVKWKSGEAILKIDPADHPHLVLNEAAHLEAARALRLPVADAALVEDRSGRPGLAVSRFDRVTEGGRVRRLALEDAGQVLGILPAAKYSVSSEEVVLGLAGVAKAPLIAARNLYLQFLFAWLTGNGDLHAKNVSLLEQPDGSWAVAPIYDVPCTWVYGDKSMALTVDGKAMDLRARHWAAFAAAIGLNQKAAASAQRLVLAAAAGVDWDALPCEGSVRRGAERELAARRRELE